MKQIFTTTRGLRPLRFDRRMICAVIPPKTKGAYVLFTVGLNGALQCIYVGRSDTDLRRRLLHHPHDHATHFVFEPRLTAEQAYHAECRAYRRFRPSLNRIAPGEPATGAVPLLGADGVAWPVPRFGRRLIVQH